MLTHYQTLEVSSSADLLAVRKAYHSISLLCHPEKTVHLPDAERAQRERLLKLANVGFEVLSDSQKRKACDQIVRLGRNRPSTLARDKTRHPHAPAPSQQPPRPTAAQPEDSLSSQSIQRAPSSTHRFTASIHRRAPDFHWYHCQLNEYSKATTLTYNTWLGWNFSITVMDYFRVIARPIIPQSPVPEPILIRLPLLRKGNDVRRTPNNICVDLRGVPENKHAILCSTLVESQDAGLELIVKFTLASVRALTVAKGPCVWRWAYNIDHDLLTAATQARVTNMLCFPYMPFIAIAPSGGMPAPPNPEESSMHALMVQFPSMKIKQSASEAYCVEGKQFGKTIWRLTAVGTMQRSAHLKLMPLIPLKLRTHKSHVPISFENSTDRLNSKSLYHLVASLMTRFLNDVKRQLIYLYTQGGQVKAT